MIINIINVKCIEKWIGPGLSGYFAEMEAEKWNDEKFLEDVYISVSNVKGYIYSVSKKSVFSSFEEERDEFEEIEHYEILSVAVKSQYFKYFVYLEKMIHDLQDNFGAVDSIKTRNNIRTYDIQIRDEKDFYLSAVDIFECRGKKLKAKVSYDTHSNLCAYSEFFTIRLVDELENIIEEFKDIDEAISSDYLMVYCDLHEYLRGKVIEHIRNNEQLNINKKYFISLFD